MGTNKHLSLRAEYFKGISIALVGVIVLSFDALLLRLSSVGGLPAAFWRAFYSALSLTLLHFITNGKKALPILKTGKWPMWFSGLLWGGSGLGFALGVLNAGVANTLVMLTLSPLFATAFSLIFYKQKPSFVTLLATVGAIIGIAYMYRNGLGAVKPANFLFALMAPLFMGSNLAFMRFHQGISRTAICMIGGWMGSVVSFVAAGGAISVKGGNMWPLALLGLVAIPFAQLMISTGTRYIPAAESALINSLETVLGITYVWLFLGEVPDADFILGALIVFISITANSAYQVRIRKALGQQ